MIKFKPFESKLTFTMESDNHTVGFSVTGNPLTKTNVMDWFECQVLPALGYSAPEREEEDV